MVTIPSSPVTVCVFTPPTNRRPVGVIALLATKQILLLSSYMIVANMVYLV